MSMNIRINGVRIKQPTSFNIEKYNLTKSGRVSSGEMTIQLVAKKRKFLFSYDVISGADLEEILAIIDTDEMFVTITYVENDIEKSAVVYSGAIHSDRFRTEMGWYWKEVKFDLIEK